MNIQAPFKIEFTEDRNAGIRELHFTFTGLFKAMATEQRLASFQAYMQQLNDSINQTEDHTNRQGMITVLQICQQLFPHLQADEVPLHQTLVVEMGEQCEGTSLSELLSGDQPN